MPETTRNNSFNFQGLSLSYKHWLPQTPAADGVVIALHGWMDNAGTFDKLIPYFPQQEFVALDFSGHGLSDRRSGTGDYYLWSFVEEVMALIEHLGQQRVILLGHSMGAAVASICAALYPEVFSKLIMLDVIGPITTAAEQSPDQMVQALKEKSVISSQRIRHYETLEEAQVSRANKGITVESSAILGVRGIDKDDEGYYWTVDRQLTRRNLMSFTEEQAQAFLKRIESDSLLIYSSQFWANRKREIESRIQLFNNLKHQELDGNHFQHLEGKVEEVASIVRSFLEKSSRTEPAT